MPSSDSGVATAITVFVFLIGIVAAGLGATALIQSATVLGKEGIDASDRASAATAGHLTVVEAMARRAADGGILIEEYLTPAPGSGAVLLADAVLSVTIGGQQWHLAWSEAPGDGVFVAEAIRDADGSLDGPAPVATQGDLMRATFTLDADGAEVRLGAGEKVQHVVRVGGSDALAETLVAEANVDARDLVGLTK